MNKMMLTVTLAGLIVAAPGLSNAGSTSTTADSRRGACPANVSTTDCLKQAGSDTVEGLGNAGKATINYGKNATNAVVGGAKDLGNAATKPFTSNGSSSSSTSSQQSGSNNQ